MKTKNLTIDDLAVIVNKGFQSMQDRFDNLEQDVSVLKSDMSDVKLRLEQSPYKYELDDLKQRVTKLEKKH